MAGVATQALHPFMLNTEAVASCFGTVQSIASARRLRLQGDRSSSSIRSAFHEPERAALLPYRPGAVEGLAPASPSAMFPASSRMNRGDYVETLPIIQFDMILEVRPPRGGEIEFENIRKLIYTLRDPARSVPIKWISFDQYQSRDSMQIMHQQGFMVGYQSMDIDTTAYERDQAPRSMTGASCAPPHAKAQEGNDHARDRHRRRTRSTTRRKGSKDVSDSMAGVVGTG